MAIGKLTEKEGKLAADLTLNKQNLGRTQKSLEDLQFLCVGKDYQWRDMVQGFGESLEHSRVAELALRELGQCSAGKKGNLNLKNLNLIEKGLSLSLPWRDDNTGNFKRGADDFTEAPVDIVGGGMNNLDPLAGLPK